MKKRSPRNKTISLSASAITQLSRSILRPRKEIALADFTDQIINGDLFTVIDYLPNAFVDLMIIDPPYNLDKKFNDSKFSRMSNQAYLDYLDSWFSKIVRCLKPTASVYLCGDWQCSSAQNLVMAKYLHLQNRIVWQREKGRGALMNWKNCSEDIWFGTVNKQYYFNANAVKLKRKVIAPYRENGKPKDWQATEDGNFRLTAPSNFWDDISIPYWSMPENTDHPTQKPEKLIAKLILASSQVGDFIFDPFLGSGTTAVVAKKLNRHFAGIEKNMEYCCVGQERLNRADENKNIQGYTGGVFWERNSLREQKKSQPPKNTKDTKLG